MLGIDLGSCPDAKATGKGWFRRCNGRRSWLYLARSVKLLPILYPPTLGCVFGVETRFQGQNVQEMVWNRPRIPRNIWI
jgi:hypothetical protein